MAGLALSKLPARPVKTPRKDYLATGGSTNGDLCAVIHDSVGWSWRFEWGNRKPGLVKEARAKRDMVLMPIMPHLVTTSMNVRLQRIPFRTMHYGGLQKFLLEKST